MKTIKIKVETEKKGLFGTKKVIETRTIKVDNRTYKEMMKRDKDRPYSIGELMLYDEVFDDWDS